MDINNINLNNGYKIIEASAGTGKTFTLSHLFLRNYIENKFNIDNILLLSFTNKTCNELREKIIERFIQLELFINKKITREKLDETLILWYEKHLAENNDKDEVLYKIKKFLNNVNNLNIFTFHGFCNNMLENYSFEIKSQQGSILNNEIDYLYIDLINELWLSEFTNLDLNIIKSIDEKKIKSKWLNISKINKKFFLNLLKEVDNENIFKYVFKDSDPNKDNISLLLKIYIKNSWKEFVSNWEKQGQGLFSKLIDIGYEINQKGLTSSLYKSKPRNKVEQINSWIKHIDENILFNENDNKYIYEITKPDILTKYFYRKSIYKELDKLNIKIDISKYSDLQESIYKIKDGFYNQFIRIFFQKLYLKLINLKSEKGILNYSDIIKTIENKCLLESDSKKTFLEIANKYKTIFIDEFQDTDKVQWGIIKKIFKDSEHLLICVGDPKQAIYKFRGGDIKAYLNAKQEALKIYKLDVNYRSSYELVEIINQLYKKGLQASKIDHKKLLSYRKSRIDKSNNYFKIIEFQDPKNISEYTTNFLIKFLLSENNFNLENIAILTNNNYQCLVYKNILKKYNIPCNIINKKNIFDTEASFLIELFLDCLNKPFSRRILISLSTSKLIKLNIKKLLDYENIPEIDILFSKFKLWTKEIRERGFISILRECIILYKSSSVINDVDLYSNLMQLAEIIEEKMIKEEFNISKVVTWYKYEMNEFSRNCKGDKYLVHNKNDSSAINISTIHSSKGLEYEVVICPFLWDEKKTFNKANGPIWKNVENNQIYINIDNSCYKAEKIRSLEFNEQSNELERLIYVALTRAKHQLIVFNNLENTDNILNKYLLKNLNNYDNYKYKLDLKLKDIEIKKIKTKFEININKEFVRVYNSKRIKKKVLLNRVVNMRSSYSSWISSKKIFNLYKLNKDYDDNFINLKNNNFLIKGFENNLNLEFNRPNPLSDFPKGSNAGICLHKIIERLNFHEINNIDKVNKLIEEELYSFGFDKKFTKNIRDGLKRMIFCSLGEMFQNQSLINVTKSDILKEIKFDLPLSYFGKTISSRDLSNCFLLSCDSEFGKDYADMVKELNIYSKGFYSGCIDCLFKITDNNNDSKWWIIDWKSNFLSTEDEIQSLPKNYNYENMRSEMIKHHYPLQSHLYLLAVHRLLKWRLKDYVPDKHLGGYIYVFIRGLPSVDFNDQIKNNILQPGIFASSAPIERILYLDKLFNDEI